MWLGIICRDYLLQAGPRFRRRISEGVLTSIFTYTDIFTYPHITIWVFIGPKMTINLKALLHTYARVKLSPKSQPSRLSSSSATHLCFASLSQLVGIRSTRVGLRPCQSKGDQAERRQHTQPDGKGLARLGSAGYRRASKHEGCEEGDLDTVWLARADTVAAETVLNEGR